MVEENSEQKEKIEFSYEEISVGSFEEAAEIIRENDVGAIELIDDIDGTLFDQGKSDKLLQYPLISPFIRPFINERNQRVFIQLAHQFEGRMVIATNRNPHEDFLWNSNEVLATVKKLITDSKVNVPMFENMQKQLPKLFKNRVRELAECIAHSAEEIYGEDYEKLTLISIEDASWVSFNREGFLLTIAEILNELLDKEVEIKNYVIE